MSAPIPFHATAPKEALESALEATCVRLCAFCGRECSSNWWWKFLLNDERVVCCDPCRREQEK